MKHSLAALLLVLSVRAYACELELGGSYYLENNHGALVESLQLRIEKGQLVAYTKENGDWAVNPHQPQPYSTSAFSAFTKQEAPAGYCGVLVSGAILARVAKGWHWAGLTSSSGFVIISIAGPREAVRK